MAKSVVLNSIERFLKLGSRERRRLSGLEMTALGLEPHFPGPTSPFAPLLWSVLTLTLKVHIYSNAVDILGKSEHPTNLTFACAQFYS